MEDQYRKEIARWFAELVSESEEDNYLALFPELNSRLSKFAIGILITSRWNTGVCDTGDFITVDELKSILGTDNYNKLLC